jgi:ketosteroid isomerase-like protein
MSQENVELVRSIFAPWERGDFSAETEWADPEIEYAYADGPAPAAWTGRDGMAKGFSEGFLSAWEDVRIGADDYRELDAERVLVLIHRSGRGKASGLELAQMRSEGALLFHIRDGKVRRIAVYWDRQRAFADLGLSEQDAHAAS